jgi:hypothetical protein
MEKYFSSRDPQKPVLIDENIILYRLITSLSTFQEHNESRGRNVARDEHFADYVIEVAKHLAELKRKPAGSEWWGEKDPTFAEGPHEGKYNGEMTITLFGRTGGPVTYKFTEQPIITGLMEADGPRWYMWAKKQSTATTHERIPLTNKEAALLWFKVYEDRH